MSPYRDPYDEPLDDPDLDRSASPYRDPCGEASGDLDADRPTPSRPSPYGAPRSEPTGSDEPTESVRYIESAGPVRPAGAATSSPTPTTSAGEAGKPAGEAGKPAVPIRQRTDEPIVDPVDVPLDAHDDEPSPDDLDEAIFGAEPDGGTTPISGVGITVLVTNLDRSVEFYRDTLGFEEFDRGSGNAVLASGSTRLVLREVSEAAPISRRLVHVNLEVDDIQAAYERLRESGIRFTYAPRVVNRGTKLDVWAAAFRDPDGHGIALTQWRTRADV